MDLDESLLSIFKIFYKQQMQIIKEKNSVWLRQDYHGYVFELNINYNYRRILYQKQVMLDTEPDRTLSTHLFCMIKHYIRNPRLKFTQYKMAVNNIQEQAHTEAKQNTPVVRPQIFSPTLELFLTQTWFWWVHIFPSHSQKKINPFGSRWNRVGKIYIYKIKI